MRETLEIINQMQSDGVIGKYAIGGAVGAAFYVEPSTTFDLDIFVLMPASTGALITLSPIYDYLSKRGCSPEAEHIVIAGWPVQFLSASNTLEEEAIEEAVSTEVDGVPTQIMPPEHLIAIALRTGRPKDHLRILQFVDQKMFDMDKLTSLLQKHGLFAKWKAFQERYGSN